MSRLNKIMTKKEIDEAIHKAIVATNTYFNDDPRYVREKVLYLESEMKKMPQVNIAVTHYFSEGVYAREMFVPKGVMLTGKIHKYTQLNILSKGEVSVLVDNDVIRVKAPYTLIAKAGSKRVFLAHEDSIWTVIHGTHETDLEKIEAHFIAETEQEYLEFCGQISLLSEYCEECHGPCLRLPRHNDGFEI